LIPVIFTSQNSSVVTVLCLVDSGATGVLLPSELADELGLVLETPSIPVVGVTGVGYGWVHPLTATLPELDGLTLSVEAVFLPQLPVALLGRSPLFQRVDIAFQHVQGNLYFNLA
jgi:predicted aspartyl protease